ncbi:hypothetical protein SY88_08520 [Clostridiales bacterium PH28_bin88]|nr:hypothetical protein SY88_08520 [Clostridiales bacterium PH28_bin88]
MQEATFLKRTLENLPVGLIVLDRKGDFVFVNRVAETLLDIRSPEVRGKGFSDYFFHGEKYDDRGHYFHPLIETLETGKEYVDAVAWLFFNKQIRHYVFSTRRLYRDDGEVLGAFISFRDITEVSYREEELAAREESQQEVWHLLQRQSEYILSHINVGVIALDWNKGIITTVNKEAERALGISAKEAIGKLASEILAHVTVKSNDLFEALSHRMPVEAAEAEVTVGDQEKIFLVNANIVGEDENQTGGLIIVFHDITELRKNQEIVRRQEKLASIGQLAAGMAHEIRNPLTSVKGFVQMLENNKDLQTNEKVREYLSIIAGEINRTNRIISDFLAFARPRKPETRQCDLNNLLESATALVESTCLMNGVQLSRQLDAGLPGVWIDPNQITQVILNLLNNAIDAMKESDTKILTVTTGQENGCAVIRVIDTGLGIAPGDLPKLCTPFFSTKENGTGLGLSISYNIMREHSGTLLFESKVGAGTTATLTLPIN